MGVLACSRLGCKRVMCDRFSHEYGYLCSDCFDELIAKGVCTDIDTFMGTETDTDDCDESFNYFDKIFPYTEDEELE